MEFQITHPHLTATLEDRGIRVTPPRKAIADLLERKRGGFTIEALAEELPSVGRATVYRTVKLLVEAGVVCKLARIDGSRVYSVARAGHHHHHYLCIKCGAVEEFSADAVEQLLRAIGTDLPGQVVDHRIEMYLICDYCPAKGANKGFVSTGTDPTVAEHPVTIGTNT